MTTTPSEVPTMKRYDTTNNGLILPKDDGPLVRYEDAVNWHRADTEGLRAENERLRNARDVLAEELARIGAAVDAAGGNQFVDTCEFIASLRSQLTACQQALEEREKQLTDGIREISRLAAGHHDCQQSWQWLHALTIDIPHHCEVLLQSERQPLCHPSRFDAPPPSPVAAVRCFKGHATRIGGIWVLAGGKSTYFSRIRQEIEPSKQTLRRFECGEIDATEIPLTEALSLLASWPDGAAELRRLAETITTANDAGIAEAQ